MTLLLDLPLVSENSSNDKPMKAEFTPLKLEYTEVVVRRFSVKKVFLEISEIHRKTPVQEVDLQRY